MTTTQTTLPLNQLRIDDKINVRKIGRGAETDFIASIKALGIQMPLIVRQNGKGYVVADGGKRLEAAQALVKSGDWKSDAPVPVIVTTANDAEARELSLALNLIRADMHPVDAFRAFTTLHTDKEKPLDVEAIALRFGLDKKTVRQRLALGALDDVILNAWQKNDLREADVQAFTLQPDKKAQVAIFTKLRKSHNCYSHAIRAEIKAGQQNVAILLKTVGEKAYEAKGGKITRDLFGSDVIVSDPALLQTMLDEQLQTFAKEALAAGWAWVETTRPDNAFEYGKLDIPFKATAEEKAKLKKLDAKVDDGDEDAYEKAETLRETILQRALTPELKKKAGVRITLEHDGFRMTRGLIKPSEKKTTKTATASAATSKGTDKKAPATITKALSDRLHEQRVTAIKAAIKADDHGRNALGMLLADIVATQIHPESRYSGAPDAITKRYDAIANAVTPKIMNEALRKAFDPKGYFEGCGKAFCLAAITEAVNADEARKVSKSKRGEIAKFALANVGKTKWLPKELRTSHYDGPVAKAATKKPAKKAAKRTAKAKRK